MSALSTRARRGGFRPLRVLLLALALSVAAVAFASPASADVGLMGPSTSGSGGSPTGEKPESKLWFNDGSWWGVLWNSATADFEIYKLNATTTTWSTTGTAVDSRSGTRQDALWDGTHLYVASHVFDETPQAGAADASRLYRFSYNAGTKTYSLDAGFPATINALNTETLVIDKDTTGRLWATWVFGGQVFVAHTTSSDSAWSGAFQIPATGAGNLSSDDISSVIAFSDATGPKIGVMWSNQTDDTMYFAYHADGAGDAAWTGQAAFGGAGTNLADDHINLKQSGGVIYAATKTSKGVGTSNPLLMLLVRSAAGVWSNYTAALGTDDPTRPIVLLDPTDNMLHYYMTGHAGTGSSGFDAIFEKDTSMSSPSLGPGLGTVVIDSTSSEEINNATSTKQNVSPATGIEILASAGSHHYWHVFQSLSGQTPTAPTNTTPPSIGGQTVVGQALTGNPGVWSGTQPITFHYEWHRCSPGCVVVGSDSPSYPLTSADLNAKIEVKVTAHNSVPPDGVATSAQVGPVTNAPSQTTLAPTADSYVKDSSPNANFGSSAELRGKASGAQLSGYLKFDTTAVTGSITSAKLRLFVTDASPDGGHFFTVGNNFAGTGTPWTESGLTFANAPAISGTAFANAGNVAVGTWVELDVSSIVTGHTVYSFAFNSLSTNSVIYSSKEGANAPQLVVTTGSGGDGTPPSVVSSSPTAGATGVAVSSNVTATFSEDVQGVNGSTFTLTRQGGSAVTATVAYNSSSDVATLDPAADLLPSTTYTASLTGGPSAIRDGAGNALSPNPTTFSFTTAGGGGGSGTIALNGPAISASIATGATLSLPSWTPAANDLILIEVATRDESKPVTVAGNGLTWTQLANVDNVQGQGGVAVFWAQGAAPTTGQITVTLTGNAKPAVAIAQRFSGVSTTTPIEASATNAGPAVDGRDMLQAVTTGTAGAWAVALGWHRAALFSLPAGQTALALNQVAGTGGDATHGSMWYRGPIASPGSVQLGAASDLSSANDWSLVVLSLKPAP